MNWTITIADDPDTTGEKTVTGIWADKSGEHSFSMRCQPNAKGQDGFIQAAMRARDEWQEKKATELDFVETCLAKLNATDAVAIAASVEVK